MAGRTAAFFDVDGTLITVTSMFRFLDFDLAVRGLPPSAFHDIMAELGRLKAAGQERTQTNRAFYRNFTGRDVAEMAAHGRAWFDTEHAGGGLFDERAVAAFRAHAACGDLTVLVSGSFPACLEPIAAYLNADLVLCSRPEIVGGVYSGELTAPMIGPQKALAVRAAAARHDVDLDRSYAYGDHLSDLPLLEVVGHPVVVGADPELGRLAQAQGWPRLGGSVETHHHTHPVLGDRA